MRNVAPTRTNLMRLKDELYFAETGRELLDQKRNILVMELLSLVDQAVEYEAKLDASLDQAYSNLQDAVMSMGRLKVSAIASAVDIRSSMKVRQRHVMGVVLPIVDTDFKDQGPYYSPLDTSASLDRTAASFKEALSMLGHMAELRVSLARLSREVRKTIRKVNALEKIAIPELEETLHYIRNRLEESERDMFVLMKTVKDRLHSEKLEVTQG